MRRLTTVLAIIMAVSSDSVAIAHSTHEHAPETEPETLLRIRPVGAIESGGFNVSAAESLAYDGKRRRIYVTNAQSRGIDAIDISDPATPKLVQRLALKSHEGSPTSVAVHGDMIAVTVPAPNRTDTGSVVFFDPAGARTGRVAVGASPDMAVFDAGGKRLLVANEGTPSSDYRIDPEGSISIIDLSGGLADATVRTADFRAFGRNRPLDPAVRIFGPGASAAQDLEPEFIAVCPGSSKAYATLQENNAIAEIDIDTATIENIYALGTKDHSKKDNGLDVSAKDQVRIFTWPVHGMYQPDGIVCAAIGGREYLLTANEGDAREYDKFDERTQVAHVNLDAETFGGLQRIKSPDRLGELRISKIGADIDGDGDFDRLLTFGARSFSIRTTDAELVYDSGDAIERAVARTLPDHFNSTNISNDSFDSRSPHKGPEPEGLVVGRVAGREYVFVGLERVGGIVAFDLQDPAAPRFAAYVNDRNFAGSPERGTAGELGVEGLVFIPASEAPQGRPLLVTVGEISGTTTIWEIETLAAPK